MNDIALGRRQQYVLVICSAFAGFAIPVSTAGLNVGTALLMLCFLCMVNLRRELPRALVQPLSIACLGLYGLLVVGTLWSTAAWAERFEMLERMHPYLLLPALLATMSSLAARRSLIGGFIGGVALSAILSIFSASTSTLLFHAEANDYTIFRTHTYHNLFIFWVAMGILAVLVRRDISTRVWAVAAATVFCVLVFDAMFLVRGRSAQILFLLMLSALLVSEFGARRTVLPLLTGMALVGYALYFLSPQIRTSVSAVERDIREYRQGIPPANARGSDNSLGLRAEFSINTLRIIHNAPFAGHGTGSFRTEYEALTGFSKEKDGARASHNPHNDYLWLWAEVGPLGVVGLVGVLVALFAQARRGIPQAQRHVVAAIGISMGVGTLGNSFFTDNTTGVGFALLASALLAGPLSGKDSRAHSLFSNNEIT